MGVLVFLEALTEAKARNVCGLATRRFLTVFGRKIHLGTSRNIAHDEMCNENGFRLIEL